jgi:hypothetical protein
MKACPVTSLIRVAEVRCNPPKAPVMIGGRDPDGGWGEPCRCWLVWGCCASRLARLRWHLVGLGVSGG